MTIEEIEEIMGNEPKIQASFEAIGDDGKFIKLIVNGKEKVVSIEELEKTLPEPCEDCISRAELLKAVDTWDKFGCDADSKLVPYKDCYVPYIHYDDVVRAIKGMPSIQPKKEWIPVSKRLPEDFQRVLVTIVNYKGDKVVRVAEYYNRKGVFQIKENHEQWEVGEKGLLAWMPLPESYKSESEDKE